MATFTIKQADGTFAEQEPTVGKWYCGFDSRTDFKTGEKFELDGALGQYVGEGAFYDDAEDDEVILSGYDYLVEQA